MVVSPDVERMIRAYEEDQKNPKPAVVRTDIPGGFGVQGARPESQPARDGVLQRFNQPPEPHRTRHNGCGHAEATYYGGAVDFCDEDTTTRCHEDTTTRCHELPVRSMFSRHCTPASTPTTQRRSWTRIRTLDELVCEPGAGRADEMMRAVLRKHVRSLGANPPTRYYSGPVLTDFSATNRPDHAP